MFIIQEFQNIMIIWYVQQFKSFKHFAICKIMMNYAMVCPVQFCILYIIFVFLKNNFLCLSSKPSLFFACPWSSDFPAVFFLLCHGTYKYR